ncbi:hypothetical protein H0E87_007347, partial [Populus deltoides]
TAVLLKLPSEKNLIGVTYPGVFLSLIAFLSWGSVSICGRRSEMEDAKLQKFPMAK